MTEDPYDLSCIVKKLLCMRKIEFREARRKQNSISVIQAGDDGGPDQSRLGHLQLQICEGKYV